MSASVFGNVAILISNISFGVAPIVQEKIDVMKEYMKFMKYNESFISTIEEYHVNIWSKQRNMLYDDNFFSDLSVSLQKLILIDQYKKTFFEISTLIPKVSIFFMNDFIPKLRPKIFMKTDIIVTEGDTSSDVYLMSNTGSVSVKIGGQWVRNLERGEFFGEVSIFLRSKRRTATITSLVDSDYLVIKSEDFEKLLRDFPNDYQSFKMISKERMLSTIKLYPSSLFAKLVPKNEVKDYLIRKSIYLDEYEEDGFFEEKNEDITIDINKYSKQFYSITDHMNQANENISKCLKLLKQVVQDDNEIIE